MADPLANIGSEVFFSIRAERVCHGNHEHGDACEDENIDRRRSGDAGDEMVKPTVLILALKKVVENDLEWPGLKKSRDAFACNSEQTKPQFSPVWAQQLDDIQALLSA
jgi:hypothetical protein